MEILHSEAEMLLTLIRAVLHPERGQEIALAPEVDPDRLKDQIQRQGLVPLVYPVIKRQSGEEWEYLQTQIKPLYDQSIYVALTQEYEIQSLLDGMEEDGIDCLPMKGWIMRHYYPETLMRSMGDMDVFVRAADAEKLCPWMERRGYTAKHIGKKRVHDEYEKPPCLYVELHKELVDLYFLWKIDVTWVNDLQKNIWKRGSLIEGKKHTYQLKDEDFYLFHLLHFYKHFLYEGAGIRLLVDTYLFLKAKEKQLDWGYLNQQLRSMHLDGFADQITGIAFKAFEGDALEPEDIVVLNFLLEGTVHGGEQNFEYVRLASQGGSSVDKNVSLMVWRRLFPSLQSMQNRYPRLYAMPWLLPVYWIIRAGRVCFLERTKMRDLQRNAADVKNMETEKYNQFKTVFEILKINQ